MVPKHTHFLKTRMFLKCIFPISEKQDKQLCICFLAKMKKNTVLKKVPNSFTNYLLGAKSISKTLEITLIKQCCNLTPACRFWATKVCLWASKIFKLCLFGRMIGQATSSNTNFENYSRCSLIKWYQFLTINIA